MDLPADFGGYHWVILVSPGVPWGQTKGRRRRTTCVYPSDTHRSQSADNGKPVPPLAAGARSSQVTTLLAKRSSIETSAISAGTVCAAAPRPTKPWQPARQEKQH